MSGIPIPILIPLFPPSSSFQPMMLTLSLLFVILSLASFGGASGFPAPSSSHLRPDSDADSAVFFDIDVSDFVKGEQEEKMKKSVAERKTEVESETSAVSEPRVSWSDLSVLLAAKKAPQSQSLPAASSGFPSRKLRQLRKASLRRRRRNRRRRWRANDRRLIDIKFVRI